ncbi:MAG: aminotransferase class V-fold PLP-dependent enzyme [Clostridia bacterium]
MNKVYMDGGATSFPKAPGVTEAMVYFLENVGSNVNRGAYDTSYQAENIVFETRELLAKLFNFDLAENVIFTKNVTESMNILIKGILKKGDHALVTSMEHNAVMRPLNGLHQISYTKIQCDKEGYLDPNDIKDNIEDNTKVMFINHGSNITGSIQNMKSIGQVCKRNNIYLIIDAAQTAGFCDVDFNLFNADAIAFTGHKSLLGPQGMGGFIVSNKLAIEMSTLIEGGTGSLSESEYQPNYMPDKFEAGTLNIPGIYGLNAALKYINKIGLEKIREKELKLTEIFLDKINNVKGLKIIGPNNLINRTAVVSLDFLEKDNAKVSYLLDKNYGIMTRCGLHCAPSAHKTVGTYPDGTVRFGLSHFHNEGDILNTIDSIKEVLKNCK